MDNDLILSIGSSRSRRSGQIQLGPARPLTGEARWIGAYWRVLGPKLLGPIAHSLGKPNVSGAISSVGRPLWPNFADLEQFQKLHRFSNKTAPFSQNEIARFFQHPVISKITNLIN